MEVSIIKKIRFIVIAILIVFTLIQNTFAESSDKSDKIAVVGDSYAGHFNINEGSDRYEYYIFPVAKIDDKLNQAVFENALNSQYMYILFTSGVNDQALNTDINVFENTLRKYIAMAIQNQKYLFFHTYMDYHNKKYGNGSYPPESYDLVYRKLANEFENVLYIDMTSFNNTRYDWGDGLHYDKLFYDALSAKLIFYVDSIEHYVFNVPRLRIKESNRRQIAVAGDIAADEFFGYENKKDYVITNFSYPNKLIFQNKDHIISAINYEAQSILISLGLKEYENQVNIHDFEDTLRECLNEACIKHKNVFIYPSFNYEINYGLPKTISEYDAVIYRIAHEYPNTCYVSLGNYVKEIPQIYDTLYEILDSMIRAIS